MTGAREQAERDVAEQLGLSVARVQANEAAEIAHARERGVPVERVGATYRMVQEQMQRGEQGR